jgi:glycosyltransferase involved in cell wall biosynthesis
MSSLVEPRTAVVIPCYNGGATLIEAVESAQPEADELVVVDDGSTDAETLAVLRGLEGRGCRVIHGENRGLSAARMVGVAATTSPYIFPLDADDVLEPGALTELADVLDAHSSAAAAWGDLRTFGLTDYRIPSVPALDPWFVTYASLLPASSLYRREALSTVGGWQLVGPYGDWDMWMAFAEAGLKGVYLPRVIYHYRRHKKSMLLGSLERFDELYAELAARHHELFANRDRNRRASSAPVSLKVAVPLMERLPRVRPLQRLWGAQLLAHLFWNGGIGTSTLLLARAVHARRFSHLA